VALAAVRVGGPRLGYSREDPLRARGTVQQRVFVGNLVGTEWAELAGVALLIARDILDAPAAPERDADPDGRVVSWLHSLVDGEIDVDRADDVWFTHVVRHRLFMAALAEAGAELVNAGELADA
jgi:hypothetical protein